MVQQFDRDLGVSFRNKGISFADKKSFQFAVVFDDAVVYYGYPRTGMRMAVDVARFAVGSPSRMADSAAAGKRLECFQFVFQIGQPAFGLDHLDFAVFNYGDTG